MELSDTLIISICHRADKYPRPMPDYLNSRDAICGLWDKQTDDSIMWGLCLLGVGEIGNIRAMVLPTARTYATRFAEWKLRELEVAKKHKAMFAAMSTAELTELSFINPPEFAEAVRRVAELEDAAEPKVPR